MPRLTNLDLDLVRTFLVVCEQKSFTRAGGRLGRSQSAISLQVRRLEDQLGQSLLSRDPRHVVLTEHGEAFLPQARRLLRLNDDILAGLAADDVE
ncbi:MAG TPA: LysR family transcriptional regulator, partial [Caulobacter sp.]